jgi:4-alpha-glucanotransferase
MACQDGAVTDLNTQMELHPELRELAGAYGIATEFWDWRGRPVAVTAETIVAVLAALDVDAGTPAAVSDALLERRRDEWRRMLPPCLVIRAASAPVVLVHVPAGSTVGIWIELEDGGRRDGLVQEENWEPDREIDGRLVGEASFRIPGDLPLGYHTLRSAAGGVEAQMPLIVTPPWLGMGDRMGERRTWGMATQLYSVRSRDSWGVGDLTDLTDLAVWSATTHSAGFVLVNPLHAAEPVAPMEPSPYLPTSRRFANPLYIRPERIPEYVRLGDDARDRVESLREQLADDVDHLDRIDRDLAWTAKRAALAEVFAAPRSAGRSIAYRAYRSREGRGLADFATWNSIAEVHGNDWHRWPEELQDPRSDAVASFATEHRHAVDFHSWLQWVLDEQLDAAQSAARSAGMPLGIMHDLAVGVHPRGADTWALQDVFARGVTVGAPPDAFNQNGQDWLQPPWRPDRLAATAYDPFRQLVATILRHAGGVRVDHIIGLFRLWWIPPGHSPTAGTYVHYDDEALLGILALEAQRAGAVVVGEDLGTVEPRARDTLRERGLLGTSILWFEFEHEADGAPRRPGWWREYCLASVTTHDLPPTAGYLAGDHVRLRAELGLLTRDLEEELDIDRAERRAWLETLADHGLLDPALVDDPQRDVGAVVSALHRYLLSTPARLLCLSLTDAVGDRRTQNQPGTLDEYPNWRVPLSGPDGAPVSLEDVFVSERAAELAAMLGDR